MPLFIDQTVRVRPHFVRANIKDFEVQIGEDVVDLSFESDMPESASDLSGSGRKHATMRHRDLERLPHELVASVIGTTATDVPLSNIERRIDASDRMTPDFVHQREDGAWEVIEIKTCQAAALMPTVAESAIDKYYGALLQRAISRDIHFYVLVVGYNSVVTNMRLSDLQLRDCVAHYCLGKDIQQKCRDAGWVQEEQEEKTAAKQMILDACSRVDLDEEPVNCRGKQEPLHITRGLKDDWDSMVNPDIMKIFNANLPEAKRLYKENLKSTDAVDNSTTEGFNSFFAKMSQVGEKDTQDTVLHLPIAYIKPHAYDPEWHKSEWTVSKVSGKDIYSELWRRAIEAVKTSPDNFKDISVADLHKIAVSDFEPNILTNERRNKHFKVKIELTQEMSVELAMRGVQSKALKHNSRVQEHYTNSKKSYLPTTPTEDIDQSFVEGRDLFDRRTSVLCPVEREVRSLADRALRLSGMETSIAEKGLREFTRTHLAQHLSFFDEVISEVNISRLKNSNKNEFVVKRLPNYRAYLLIKTTSIDKQIFVSVMVNKEDFKGKFPLSEKWMDCGGCMITKFISLDRHKITHYLYSTYKAACLWFFWSHQFGDDPENVGKAMGSEPTFDHFWVSLLVLLEDKEKTSSSLQLVRYAYMEVVKGGILKTRPEKIVKKLDPRVRSRLLLWCLEKIGVNFTTMAKEPPIIGKQMKVDDLEVSQDTATGLLSWVTGDPIPKFEIALNLSYLGVLHNKDEGNKTHGYLKIFDKLLTQELLMPNARDDYMTRNSRYVASELRDHEFSAAAVKTFARIVKSKLEKNHADYKAWATETILAALSKKTVLELATTKSSTMRDSKELDEMKLKKDKEGQEVYKAEAERKKAMENMLELVEEAGIDTNVIYSKIDKLIDEIEKDEGMKISLFKKLQIGGTREIFVLSIRDRVVVSFLECISRALCENIGCEMLTKGDQKISRSDEHFKQKSLVMKGMDSVTVISSDDAATWAQRFVMPVFGVMLNELVPEPFLKPCLRILNLITSKRLLMPLDLVNLFLSHKDVVSSLDSMNSLKAEFLQSSKGVLLDKIKSRMILNRSNMMQGILHYTSSLLHACYMSSVSTMFRTLKVLTPVDKIIVTAKVSSDDSALLITLAKGPESKQTLASLMKVGTVMCLLKQCMCPLFCAKQSDEKSTVAGGRLIEEFNSLWYYRNTLISPSIKYMIQVPRTHVTDRFETRLNVMAGIRAQLYEATGSTLLASVGQCAQLRCHYISLGITTHKLFKKYESVLLKASHPSLGFFVYENELVCGILGLNFALFTACSKDDKVKSLTKKFMINSSLTMLEIDAGMCRLALTHGSTARYDAMLKRMEVDYGAELEYFDENPEKLWSAPQNKADLVHKLKLKAATPSVANSFEFQTDSKLHAASSYALHTKCVSQTDRRVTDFSEDGKPIAVMTFKKSSLLKVIEDEANTSDFEDVSLLELSWIFPNRVLYEVILDQIIPDASELVPTSRRLHRNWYFMHRLQKYDFTFIKKPLDVCVKKWFDLGHPGTTYEVDQTWSSLRSLFPWLCDTYRDTILRCPQNNAVGLFSFLRQIDTPMCNLKVIAPISPKAKHEDAIIAMITRSFWPGFYLEKRIGDSDHERHLFSKQDEEGTCPEPATNQKRDAISLRTTLWAYNESWLGPITTDVLEEACKNAPEIVPYEHYQKDTAWQFLDSAESRMAVFQLIARGHRLDLADLLRKARRGLVGSFVKRAKFDETLQEYTGESIFQGHYNGVPFKAVINGETLKFFELKAERHVKPFAQSLYELVRELRCSKMPIVRQESVAGYIDLFRGCVHSVAGAARAPYRINLNLRIPRMPEEGFVEIDDEGTIRLRLRKTNYNLTALTLKVLGPRNPVFVNHLCIEEKHEMYFWMMGLQLPAEMAEGKLEEASNSAKATAKKNVGDEDWCAKYPEAQWIRQTFKSRAHKRKDYHDASTDLLNVTANQSDEMIRTLDQLRDDIALAPIDEEEEIDVFAFMDEAVDEIVAQPVIDYDVFADILGEADEEVVAELDYSRITDWWSMQAQEIREDISCIQYCRPELMSPHLLTRLDHSDMPYWDAVLDQLKTYYTSRVRNLMFSGHSDRHMSEFMRETSRLYTGIPVRPRDSIKRVLEDYDRPQIPVNLTPLGD